MRLDDLSQAFRKFAQIGKANPLEIFEGKRDCFDKDVNWLRLLATSLGCFLLSRAKKGWNFKMKKLLYTRPCKITSFLPPPPSIDNDYNDDEKEETFVDDLAWMESVD